MTREQAYDFIDREFAVAETAQRAGNHGIVRVCACRAAGAAISCWLTCSPRQGWGADAMTRLRLLAAEPVMPEAGRAAAMRLTARVTDRFTSPCGTIPPDDSRIIIDHFLGPS